MIPIIIQDIFLNALERSMEAVTEYKTFRKKLDSRRYALPLNQRQLG